MKPALRTDVPLYRTSALVFLWFSASAWIRPLTGPDEGRYIGVALQMLHSGNWLVPTLNGFPFFHKPPLFYWIGAAAMSVLGVSEWAGRLPSILGASLGAVALYAFLRRWVAENTANRSLGVLCSMPFFHVGAQFANLDMLVAGCIAATVLLAAHAELLRESGMPNRGAGCAAFGMAALAVLAKGLIGLVLPGAIFVLWCLLNRRPRQAYALLLSPPGWLIFATIAAPWFVAMQLSFPDFFDYFIVTQHLRRFSGGGFNNAYGWWFYFPVITLLTLPWSAVGSASFYGWWKSRKELTAIDILMLVWFGLVVAFFSLPQSKLVGYVLPALPPLAYGIGKWLARPASRLPIRPIALSAAVICVGCVLLAGRFATSPAYSLRLPDGSTIAPRDRIVMVDDYLYEIPFYWNLRQDVYLAADWLPATANARDNWRKEMFDASRFLPPQQRSRLIDPKDIERLRCLPGDTWLIARRNQDGVPAWTGGMQEWFGNRDTAVWKLPPLAPDAPACRPTEAGP